MNSLNVEESFNRSANSAGFRRSMCQPLFAPVLSGCSVAARVGSAWNVITAAAAASPTIILNYGLSGMFAQGKGSGLKGIPEFRLRLAARLVDTSGDLSGQVLSAMLLKGATRFHSPVVSATTGIESAGVTGEVLSAAATLVCQDTVQGNAFPASAILVDAKMENIRIYEYDPLAGLTAAQRLLLTPETSMQITISTSIAIPTANQLNIFNLWLEERGHATVTNKRRRSNG